MEYKKADNCNETEMMLLSSSSSLTIEWLDSKSAAKYLCISVETLRNLTCNGQIPYYKLGHRNRYRKDEINSILLNTKRGKHGN
jgi:excisionase family DNA binding protein